MKKKATKQSKVKQVKEKQDSRIEEVYEQEVRFFCPKRGWVTQKVKIKKYKTVVGAPSKHTLKPDDDIIEKLDGEDNGLQVFGDESTEE